MYELLLVDDEGLTREGISENVRWEELGYHLAGPARMEERRRSF